MYMQVDVPMERMPVANWLLIVGTCVVSVVLRVADSKYERAAGTVALEVAQRKVDAAKQLESKRLTPKQREAAERTADEELTRFVAERVAGFGQPPVTRWALHTDWADFRFVQLVTHAFAHGDILHLVGNMLFLFCFGNAVCAKVGNALYVPLYLLFAVLTGIASVALRVGVNIGASGAIMGVTGLFLVLYPLNEIAVWTLRSLAWSGDAWRFPSWVFIAFYMALDLLGLMMDRQYGGGINYIAHLSGWAAGVVIDFALAMTRFIESNRGEQFLPETWGWLGEKPVKRGRKKKRRNPPPDPNRVYEV